jgi:predicted RNA-binding Zn ribbon-like protein
VSKKKEAVEKKAARKQAVKPFEMIGGHAALDFVNSIDNRFTAEPLELLREYEDLLRFVWQAGLITERQLRELKRLRIGEEARRRVLAEAIELREGLARVLYGRLDGEEVGKRSLLELETVFKEVAGHRRLTFLDKKGRKAAMELTWEFRNMDGDGRAPMWLLAQAANELLTSSAAERIRACASPTCRWLFLDVSKNHSRRWCDMKICGNRNKARRFQLRQAEGAGVE